MIRPALISLALLAACVPQPQEEVSQFAPDYLGVEAVSLDSDLVQIDLRMRGARGPEDVDRYGECAAAGYTLSQGYGFARHLRTNIDEKGGVWTADAVYTISPTLPRGLMTIDAEVMVADCAENGIPTV
ncbi:hypothetical protein Q5Y75_00255 [Ruegeria sp. 2205SS24-7]|uniref:hypothetical protein n=1 Tax=Ruegeria discodermiae TaxID=3064389 RepID=UPI0027413C9A|nr:hypothetical protein [Ruegeria sp. 2205SS24-7]MDP5215639.1 hypothetical protein [Ruegeria sp. 2205SS24-7]